MPRVIFEDAAHGGFAPLVDFRPLWRLKLGCGELADRLAGALPGALWWPRDELRPLCRRQLFEPRSAEGEVLLINARLADPAAVVDEIAATGSAGVFRDTADGPVLLWCRFDSKDIRLEELPPPSDPAFHSALLPELPPLEQHPASYDFPLLSRPWELVAANAAVLKAGFTDFTSGRVGVDPGCTVIGDVSDVFIEDGASVEPSVILDATEGPVVVAAGASIKAPARLEGPCFIDSRTVVDGAVVRPGTSVGRNCRIAGEVEESLISDHVNKHHYGFLGHAYLGEWVNLGAGTTNSDLKNNYGEVRVHTPEGRVDSGSNKVGCFIGDHTKTGIGTLIGTGVSLGCFCNVYDAPTLSDWLTPFSWLNHRERSVYRLDKALETAAVVMGRRGVELTPELSGLIRRRYGEYVDAS